MRWVRPLTIDGSVAADRFSLRARLAQAYDRIFDDATIDRSKCVDFVESKLFGIGCEEYTVGSAEFCADYALGRKIGLCLDMGHFHPTEALKEYESAGKNAQRLALIGQPPQP